MNKKKGEMKKVVRYLCLLTFTVFCMMVFAAQALAAQEPAKLTWTPGITVTTLYGKVKGYESSPDALAWKAIPYAKPPVGELRWKAPQNPDPWTGVKEATEFCERCPQYTRTKGAISIVGNEDCLYLNIWRPKSKEIDLPVYFSIHGGGNSAGTASWKFYDGVKMASKSNMVIVTINYRLGPAGWFTHPALRHGKDAKDDSGNYGTLDIIQALEWVRDNIKAFGGDPGNITIAGESAGAHNVLSLLISPLAKSLFHKAIAQSFRRMSHPISTADASANAVIERLLVNDGTVADETAAKAYIAKKSNAEIENYLRSKTVKEILKGHEKMIGVMIKFPNILADGVVIAKDGYDALNDPNRYNQVPIILGHNKEELKLFMGMGPAFKRLDPVRYQNVAKKRSDEQWKSKVDEFAKLSAQETQPVVYAYQFNYGAYNPDGYNAWPLDHEGVKEPLIYKITLNRAN